MKNAISAIVIGVAAIICFWIASNALTYRYRAGETISVTGLAETDFTSDLIVWNATYSRKSLDLKNAYAQLKADESTIRNYVHAKGVSDSEMAFNSVEISKDFVNKYDANDRQIGAEFTGYNLKQELVIESKDVGKVEKLSREITELIQGGIELNSSQPSYYFLKLW